jgi:ABC-type multidrug transport system fused ATPase/permease subunit
LPRLQSPSVRFGGKLVIEGDLTVGDLVAFMLYTTQIGASIGMMSGLVGSFFVAQGASKRSFQLIDREPKVSRRARSLRNPPQKGGALASP